MPLARAAPAFLAAGAGLVLFALAAAALDPALRPGSAAAPRDGMEEEIRATLRDYQRIYQDFFASGGVPSLLDDFPASRDVKHHVFRDLGYVRDAGLVLVQDLATATVTEVKATGPSTAEATVYEEWNYVFQRAADRVPASALKGMGQGFRYTLAREAGGWRVVGWELADVPRPPDTGERKW